MAISASIREPRRLVPFALAVLVHVGLWQLLVSQRQPSVATAEPGAQLVFLRDPVKPTSPPLDLAPPRLQKGRPRRAWPRD